MMLSSVLNSIFGNKEEDRKAVQAIVKCTPSFAYKLYKVISREKKGDIFFSPLHLQHALASLACGCTGKGIEELQLVLDLPKDKHVLERGYNCLYSHMHSMKDVTMATANRVITSDHTRLLKDYYVSSHKHFSMPIKPTDLTRPHEELRTSINNWIKKSTRGKITDLIPPGTVNLTIQMLIISAVYFSCKLEKPFLATDTTNDLFYVDKENTRTVKLMHQTGLFQYGEFDHLQCQAVEIPFKCPHLKLLILLPFSVDGLELLEDKMSGINPIALLDNMVEESVLISMPSFRLQEQYDICDYLEQVGLNSLLETQERPMLKVSKCLPPMAITQFNHEFCFELSEEGAQIAMLDEDNTQEIPNKTHVLRADHPFMFSILDVSINASLAFGRITCQDRFPNPVYKAQNAEGVKVEQNTKEKSNCQKEEEAAQLNVNCDQMNTCDKTVRTTSC